MATHDPVAHDVAPTLAQRKDVVRLRVWVGEGPKTSISALYLDSRFSCWLEVTTTDIVSQVQGLDFEGASIVWVNRDAKVKRVEALTALEYAERYDEDPAGGTYPKR
jgi:hypothetical protein